MNTPDAALPPAQPPSPPARWGLRTLALATVVGLLAAFFSESAELAVASAALALEAMRELRN